MCVSGVMLTFALPGWWALIGTPLVSVGCVLVVNAARRQYEAEIGRQVPVMVRPGRVVSDVSTNTLRQEGEVFHMDTGTAWSLEKHGYVHVLQSATVPYKKRRRRWH